MVGDLVRPLCCELRLLRGEEEVSVYFAQILDRVTAVARVVVDRDSGGRDSVRRSGALSCARRRRARVELVPRELCGASGSLALRRRVETHIFRALGLFGDLRADALRLDALCSQLCSKARLPQRATSLRCTFKAFF